MNHLQVLKSALEGQPKERAEYFAKLGDLIEETPRFEPQRQWMLMVLKAGIDIIPPLIEPPDMAMQLALFVAQKIGEIQSAAYSPDFVLKNGAPMVEVAMMFAGEISASALDAYRDGKLESDEPELHVFRWPYTGEEDFPYSEEAIYAEDD